jgi:hypothetical protein
MPIDHTGRRAGTRLRPALSLFAYVCAVFLGGALLAPWLYRLVGWSAPASALAAKPFHRYLDRCLQVIALLGLWPLLRGLELRSPLVLLQAAAPARWRRLAHGAAVGFVSLGLVALLALAAQVRQFGPDLHGGRFWGKLAGATGAAIAVGFLEEFLFRGAVYGALRRAWNWRIALVASSLIYAVVHFIQKSDLQGAVTWHSGLDLLPQMLASLANPHEAVPAFLVLTLAGVILALAYQRTGDLYFSIGLHASWVFWIKSYGILTVADSNVISPLFGTGEVVDGWLAPLVLLMVLLLLPRRAPGPRREGDA